MSKFIPIFLCCLLMNACVDQEIVDRIALPLTGGVDFVDNNEIELTFAFPSFSPGNIDSVSDQVITLAGPTKAEITEKMQRKINRRIYPSKTTVFLYGKEVAAQGLEKDLDVILRDGRSTRKMHLAVVDGTAKELLHADFSGKEVKGMFLERLLEENIEYGYLPKQDIHLFEYALLGRGIDPFLPLIKLDDDHKVTLCGLALFKHDKYITSINVKEMTILKLLLEDKHNGRISVKLPTGTIITVQLIRTKPTYHLIRSTDNLEQDEVHIMLNMKVTVSDLNGENFSSHTIEEVREALKENLERSGNELMWMFQRNEIDPLGIGDFVRSKTRHWEEDTWKAHYPHLKLRTVANIQVVGEGIRR